MIDFILSRAKENSAMLAEITGALKNNEYAKAMKLFLALQQASSSQPPVAVNFQPKSIDQGWKNHEELAPREGRQTLVLYGYNFVQGKDRGNYTIEIRDETGQHRRFANEHFRPSNAYLAQLDISRGSGLKLKPDDKWVVIAFDSKPICILPVTWAERPPPPDVYVADRLTMRVKMGAEKKNQNYGINVVIRSEDGKVEYYNSKLFRGDSKARFESNIMYTLFEDSPRAGTGLRPGSMLLFEITSEHLASGWQLEGIWDGTFELECNFTNGKDKKQDFVRRTADSSPQRFDHKGEANPFAGKDRNLPSVSSSFKLQITGGP
jgi:hypothetical protein